jgi:tetratricopeptide (TPR) repeat protein/predicted Ser/Thr protein kinase
VDLRLDPAGRFELHRRLGAGGMGVVYEATDRLHKTRVALKTVRHLDAQGVLRLQREFHALSDLRHTNLVRLGELFCDQDQCFFTMEFIEGQDFLDYVKGDVTKLRQALGQLAEGVVALHQAEKVHRDIKPSNVLCTREGRAVLLDFGLATQMNAENLSSSGHVVGTAAYMAPEQAASKPPGPPADWYSVGVMLYQALTGRLPFVGPPLEVMMNKHRYEPPPPRALLPEVPADLDALCVGLLHFDPDERPSGRVVLETLGIAAPGHTLDPSAAHSKAPPFVGRARELATLKDALVQRTPGSPVSVFVHGESGLGKTSLVRHFLAVLEAEAPGIVVLAGRCYERESVPFNAWAGIIESLSHYLAGLDPIDAAFFLPRDAAQLARIFPVLRRIPTMVKIAQGQAHVLSPHELRARAFAALRELLVRMTDRGPVVLFVDDFQWADADSLALLGEVMHPPDAPALVLVSTVRTSTAAPAKVPPGMLALTRELAPIHHLQLGALTLTEGRELAETLLADTQQGTDVDAIAREASGHPMFIYELVRHMATATEAPISVRLDDALGDRVKNLEPAERQLLQLVAIAGAPLTRATATQALGLAPRQVDRIVRQLCEAHLLRHDGGHDEGVIETYHDRVREAVLARLDGALQTELHAALADALEVAGAAEREPHLLVRHLLCAGERRRAGIQAERAARLATDKLAFDQAADLYGRALELSQGSEAELRRIRLLLGDALFHAGRGPEAAETFLAAAQGADPSTQLLCQRRAAEQYLASGHIEAAWQALRAAIRAVGVTLPTGETQALVSLVWQRAKLRLRGLGFRPRDESEIPVRDLVCLDIYRSVACGLAMVDNVLGAAFQTRWLLLALKTGEPRRVAHAMYQEAVYLSSQRGTKRRVDQLVTVADQITTHNPDAFLSAFRLGSHGVIDYFRGDFRPASEKLTEAQALFRDYTTGTTRDLGTARLFQLHALRHLGAMRDLQQGFDQYVRDAVRRGDRYLETTLVRASNIVFLAMDAPDEARRALGTVTWSPPERGYHMQHWYDLRARAEIDLYQGLAGDARARWKVELEKLMSSLLQRVCTTRADSRYLLGRLALAEAQASPGHDGALGFAETMARELAGDRVGYARAWAQLLWAGVAARRRDPMGQRTHLVEAISLCETSGLALCAAAARRRLATVLGGSEGQALRSQVDAWMASQGLLHGGRIANLVAPGWDDD